MGCLLGNGTPFDSRLLWTLNGVEIGGGVEPEIELLLFVSFALSEDVGVDKVGIS
ncbi:hypothetical protein LINPERPRIM_LOCUS3060 [Linum perenne]